MERLEDVTLEQVYKLVLKEKAAFAFWMADGNFLGEEPLVEGTNVKTCVFLSRSIFILELSVEIDGTDVIASRADLLDIWQRIKERYPKLFETKVKGNVMLTS